MKLSHAPLRLSTGAFILNSGVSKLQDRSHAPHIHKLASETYPQLANVQPEQFQVMLGAGETALGAALLLPIVPARTAGLGLFSAGLLGMYVSQERFRRGASDPRPSQEGTALAKDVWMLGIALSLMIDGSSKGKRRSKSRADRRSARKAHSG